MLGRWLSKNSAAHLSMPASVVALVRLGSSSSGLHVEAMAWMSTSAPAASAQRAMLVSTVDLPVPASPRISARARRLQLQHRRLQCPCVEPDRQLPAIVAVLRRRARGRASDTVSGVASDVAGPCVASGRSWRCVDRGRRGRRSMPIWISTRSGSVMARPGDLLRDAAGLDAERRGRHRGRRDAG